MDSNKFDGSEVLEWGRLFDSDFGKKIVRRFEQIKELQLAEATALTLSRPQVGQDVASAVFASVNKAAGVELILSDIRNGIAAAKAKKEKKED